MWCSEMANVTVEEVKTSSLLRGWLSRARAEEIDVRSIYVVQGYKWGEPNEVRLLWLEVDASHGGRKFDRQVYLCADVVSAITTVVCEDQRYGVLTWQSRLVSPGAKVLDWPCGTIESTDSGLDMAGLREAQEETGTKGLVEWRLQPNPQHGLLQSRELMAVSEGRTSEGVGYIWLEAHVTSEVLAKLQGREAGLHEENEHTTVVVAPWSDVPLLLGQQGRACLKAVTGWLLVHWVMGQGLYM